MASTEGQTEKRARRKLVKKRKPQRHTSTHFPERLEYGDDAQEDVTAAVGKPAQFANQSIFSMIAAAGSRTNFHARFEDESSESEGDDGTSKTTAGRANYTADSHAPISASRDDNLNSGGAREGRKHVGSIEYRHHRIPLPRLHIRTTKERKYLSQSSHLPSTRPTSSADSPQQITPRDAPVMSQTLAAKGQLDPTTELTEEQQSADMGVLPASAQSSDSLASRLMEIFDFHSPEEVISEYPCWLMQSVLLQGYMYITQAHICFYAYLPKKSNVVAKSGYLTKRGKQNPKFNRYWFVLKGDVLSYFTDPSDLYFPSGNIDLTYGISACLEESKEKGKDSAMFSVVTNQRIYHLKADSPSSAKEWVKTLQKVIFRSHNDGDSVKISLPVENVIDIEESPVIDFAKTLKVRVVESDETYAIDEVRACLKMLVNQLLTGRSTFSRSSASVMTHSKFCVQRLTAQLHKRSPKIILVLQWTVGKRKGLANTHENRVRDH